LGDDGMMFLIELYSEFLFNQGKGILESCSMA